jgi:hypothetical protein
MPSTENVLGEPCQYNFKNSFPWLLSCRALRDVILYGVECRRSVQKPLRPKMRLKFRENRVSFSFTCALNGDAALIVR